MNIVDIAAFNAVAAQLSVRAASEHLRVSRGTISKRIDRLERDLGVALLHRTAKGTTLTPEGMDFYAQTVVISSVLESAESRISTHHRRTEGELHIRVQPCLIGVLASRTLPEFAAQYAGLTPSVKLWLGTAERNTGDLDVAVGFGTTPTDPDLYVRRIAGFEQILVTSPDYLRSNGWPEAPTDLLHHRCLIANRDKGQGATKKLITQGKVRHYDLPSSVKTASYSVVHAFALAHEGIALLPRLLVEVHLQERRLIQVLPDTVAAQPVELFALFRQKPKPRRVELFIDHLVRTLGRRGKTTTDDVQETIRVSPTEP